MEIKILVFTILFIFTIVSVALLMREYMDSKNRLSNVEKNNQNLEARVTKLENASRQRLPYASAESILDAMAALDALEHEESFKNTLIQNAKAHLINSMAVGTKREEK